MTLSVCGAGFRVKSASHQDTFCEKYIKCKPDAGNTAGRGFGSKCRAAYLRILPGSLTKSQKQNKALRFKEYMLPNSKIQAAKPWPRDSRDLKANSHVESRVQHDLQQHR